MIKKTILANGMAVVTEEIRGAHSVAMGIWVKAGSRVETAANAGICHFLEHMNFKGTERRTAKDLAQTLERRGGHLNAYTAKEHTSFYCQVVDEDYQLAMDVLADLFLASTFPEEEIAKEKDVVMEEINLYNDSPDDYVLDRLSEQFWQGHALARPILGFEDSVAAIRQRDLFEFRRQYYRPAETVFAAAGALSHEAIVEEANKLFAAYGEPDSLPSPPLSAPTPRAGHSYYQKDISQEHFCLGAPGCSLYDDDYYTLMILTEVLGGGPSSRLYQRIREELALAYTVFAFHATYVDSGMLGIYAGTAKGKGKQTAAICCAELADIGAHGLTADELTAIKNEIKGSMLIDQDSISARLNRMARNELYYRRVLPIHEVMAAVDAVTNEDILRVADRHYSPENLTFVYLNVDEEEV